jgi:hypothetical protein
LPVFKRLCLNIAAVSISDAQHQNTRCNNKNETIGIKRQDSNYTIMILGSIIIIHFEGTFSTLAFETKALALYSLDTLSLIILKALALFF